MEYYSSPTESSFYKINVYVMPVWRILQNIIMSHNNKSILTDIGLTLKLNTY